MHPVTKFRRKRRLRIIEYLGGVCVVCGINSGLEIDHIDPSTKVFTLSGNNLNRSWEYLLLEINKCQLLCKHHHIVKTLKDNNFVPWNKNLDNFIHGTARTYQEKKCKCDDCKLAKVLYRQKKLTYTQHLSSLTI